MTKHILGQKPSFAKKKKKIYSAFVVNKKLLAKEIFVQESVIAQHYYLDIVEC